MTTAFIRKAENWSFCPAFATTQLLIINKQSGTLSPSQFQQHEPLYGLHHLYAHLPRKHFSVNRHLHRMLLWAWCPGSVRQVPWSWDYSKPVHRRAYEFRQRKGSSHHGRSWPVTGGDVIHWQLSEAGEKDQACEARGKVSPRRPGRQFGFHEVSFGERAGFILNATESQVPIRGGMWFKLCSRK